MVILEEWLHSSQVPNCTVSQSVKAAEGASSEVALTDCETVLPGTLYCDGIDLVQFGLKEFVRSTVSEYLPRKAVAPDFDLTDLLV